MIYSCAYFTSPDDDLQTAQQRKLDYICNKLRLQPGNHLLDIGCGWGGMAIYAAENYGVHVHGITLSRNQYELANERIRQAGLADRCHIELCDYRDIKGSEVFDKIVSIGMVEHVGEANLPEYFAHAWRLLKPQGVFLNHGIGEHSRHPVDRGRSFTTKYAFPDRELVPISTMLLHAEIAGFEVRDVENLREHYALTLNHWVDNMESRHQELRLHVDEVTRRIWLLCMAGAIHEFSIGRHLLYQTLLVKSENGNAGLPLTREGWYGYEEADRD
jgi:cyclopropane-fatty-acyl-phospholipid synthase